MEIPKLSLMDINFSLPPRILVHAKSGHGKTHLGIQFPASLFFMCELGITDNKDGNIKYSAFRINSFEEMHIKLDELENFLASLKVNNYKSPYKTLVLDNLTELQTLAKYQVAKDNNVVHFNKVAYGAGYALVEELLFSEVNICKIGQRFYKGVLTRLFEIGYKYGLAVLILSQTIEEKVEENTAPRKQYAPDVINAVKRNIARKVDEIIYIENKVVEVSTAKRDKKEHIVSGYTFLAGNSHPYHETKSRYGLPYEAPHRLNEGFIELSKYLPKWYED